MEGSTDSCVVSTQSVRTIPAPTDVSAHLDSNMLAGVVLMLMNVLRFPTYAAMSVPTCGEATGATAVRLIILLLSRSKTFHVKGLHTVH